MRKTALPIGILFMVLAVLLAAIGISYGYWTDTLYIDGTLTTGHLNVYWSDWEGAPNCTLSRASDGNTLNLSVQNAYPGFSCTVTAQVRNGSTMNVNVVPGDLQKLNDTAVNMDDDLDVDWNDCDEAALLNMAPGDTAECSATISVLEGLESYQDATATYRLPLVAHQFNETTE